MERQFVNNAIMVLSRLLEVHNSITSAIESAWFK